MPRDRPHDFAGLRSMIVERRASLPKRLVQVASFAIEHPQDIAFGRVADIAAQAGVQPSTLVRFAQSFGYSGFSELQAVFQDHARQRWPDYRQRLETLGEAVDGGSEIPTPQRRLHGFVRAAQQSMRELEQGIDHRALEEAVSILAGARSIHLLAMRRVYPVTLYLLYALQRLGVRCELVDDAGGLGLRQVELLESGDVMLCITFTPYAPETLEIATAAARRGVPIVGITDSPFSPLTPIAQTWLEVAETDHAGFRSLSATFVLATTLAVSVAERRGNAPSG
ncbi:MurR/RpiR family transcriptional regulator [Acetobacteraceae bacterium KSS8]|uniref:MurR/RpiR family transcriptional regulator n=1 Tax=Endosaccharibacter trunci TaxID=2812733 RepID=A0ABT1W8Q7_9PROT|nr:MurR/RpiR family transcriptional regulator [Acetobacteraceae bacterium KSS8]